MARRRSRGLESAPICPLPETPSTPTSSLLTRHSCTFGFGAVRQDVYACTLCTPDTEPAVGFCSSCKYACHGTHLASVFDLYSKRAFLCDCGSARAGNCCALEPAKPPANLLNVYGHNFRGRYCRCERGYEPRLGEMTQCCVCEDWFHGSCVKAHGLPPARKGKGRARKALQSGAYEMTCAQCFERLPILGSYVGTLGKWGKREGGDPSPVRGKECTRPAAGVNVTKGRDVMWEVAFRKKLCACLACATKFEEAGAGFVVDPADLPGGEGSVLIRAGDQEIVGGMASEKNNEVQNENVDAWQVEMQEQIRSFLDKNTESGGQEMSHVTLRNYLADVKADVIAGLKK